jgi:acetyltransferase-like isoleucine patch superfamily enzyme
MKLWRSEGDGLDYESRLAFRGENVIIEAGVRIFHPENIHIGHNVYIGHDTILKGYYAGQLRISDNVWIGQQCFLHAGGGLTIGRNVGIGPQVKMHAGRHAPPEDGRPLLFSPIELRPIVIEDDVNIGLGATIMGGVTEALGVRVGAGAVVTKTFPPHSVLVGIPAKPRPDH